MHAVNVILHAIASALVAELGRRMTGSIRVALIAGMLFAAHPVHVEAVAMIVGRAELMCAIGVVGGIGDLPGEAVDDGAGDGDRGDVFCLQCVEQGAWAAAGADAAGACICRENGWGGSELRGKETAGASCCAAAMCLLILAYTAYRESIMPLFYDKWFMRWSVNPVVRARGGDRVGVPLTILGRYVALLVWPAKLSVDYGADVTTWVTRWRDPYLYMGIATVILYGLALVQAAKKRSARSSWRVCFAWGWRMR